MLRGLLVAATLICAPTASARGLLFGTEDIPELPDASDDVAYDPLYVGEQNHAYVDLLASWFSYDNDTDRIEVTIKTASGDVDEFADTWDVSCAVYGAVVTDGQSAGNVWFAWSKWYDEPDLRSFVFFDTDTQSGAVGVSSGLRQIDHTFEAESGKPGYFRFFVPREPLLLLGDELRDPQGHCDETFSTRGPVMTTLMENRDEAHSSAAYSFAEHRRTRSPDGLADPIEKLPTQPTETATTPSDETSTPGLGVVSLLAALGAFVLLRPRR